jgi:predicted lipoprotein with Yx(FWY)xxD motif
MSNRDVIGRRTLRARRAATIGIIAASLLSWPLAAAAATSLEAVNLTNFPGALVNQSSRTLYVLSVEKGATLKCKGACLSAWSPLLVKSSVTSITLGANVKGKIGLVKRSATTKQVTFNSYPLYTYDGDTGPRQTGGFGRSTDGGHWYLVKASASSASTTPERITMHGGTGTTTTTSTTSTTTSTTTTTLSGGAGGY